MITVNALTVIMSEIPCTPCRSTSSARRKASCKSVCSWAISSSLSLGITIRVSTDFCSLSIASKACKLLIDHPRVETSQRFFRATACRESTWTARRRPSKLNGYVTTPTVRFPASFDIRATTGAAPEPVPPPIPAVINTSSAFATASWITLLDSSADCSPSSGLPPVPAQKKPHYSCHYLLRKSSIYKTMWTYPILVLFALQFAADEKQLTAPKLEHLY